MKASKRDINLPVDIKFRKRLLKYFFWGLGKFTFWFIMFLNFLM